MSQSLPSDLASQLLAIAAELAGGDLAVGRHLLEMIIETNRTTLALLRDSAAAAAWDSAASAAHRLSGSARMLECAELVVLIDRLETGARTGNPVLAKTLVPQVMSAVAILEASIKTALAYAA